MKYEDTRIVTFKEDYLVQTRGGGSKVLYAAKDSKGRPNKYAIHKGTVAILEKNKAKMTFEKLDPKILEEKLKDKVKQQRKRQVEMSYEK